MIKKIKPEVFVYIAWIQSIVATCSSLYLSEVLHWTPCILCWYQRILMYPLVILIAVGIWRKDKGLAFYLLPLTLIGMAIAGYHTLLQAGIIPEAYAPCAFGVSCKVRHTAWFGFITIPFLSLTAFTIITLSLSLYHRVQNSVSKTKEKKK